MSIDKRKFLAALAAVGASTGLAAAQPAKKPVSYGPQRREIPQLVANAEKSAAKIAEFEVADGDEPAVVFRAR